MKTPAAHTLRRVSNAEFEIHLKRMTDIKQLKELKYQMVVGKRKVKSEMVEQRINELTK